MSSNSIEKIKELKEEMNKKFNARLLKEQARIKKKAKEELRSHVEYALTGLKLNELRELENLHLFYGIFELYTKLSEIEKEKLKERSKELEETFREGRKPKFKTKKDKINKEKVSSEKNSKKEEIDEE